MLKMRRLFVIRCAVCYTNQPQARLLLLDGREVGALKPKDDSTGVIHRDIPYAPGRLTAEGLDKAGNVAANYAIETSGCPYAIVAESDRQSFDKAGQVAIIEIEVVDENGVPVKLADNNITVRVKGGGELLALESGDNFDMGDYRDSRQRVYGGHLVAYVRCTDPTQPVELTLASPLLLPAALTLPPRQ